MRRLDDWLWKHEQAVLIGVALVTAIATLSIMTLWGPFDRFIPEPRPKIEYQEKIEPASFLVDV